jgi:hypothetical protein
MNTAQKSGHIRTQEPMRKKANTSGHKNPAQKSEHIRTQEPSTKKRTHQDTIIQHKKRTHQDTRTQHKKRTHQDTRTQHKRANTSGHKNPAQKANTSGHKNPAQEREHIRTQEPSANKRTPQDTRTQHRKANTSGHKNPAKKKRTHQDTTDHSTEKANAGSTYIYIYIYSMNPGVRYGKGRTLWKTVSVGLKKISIKIIIKFTITIGIINQYLFNFSEFKLLHLSLIIKRFGKL